MIDIAKAFSDYELNMDFSAYKKSVIRSIKEAKEISDNPDFFMEFIEPLEACQDAHEWQEEFDYFLEAIGTTGISVVMT
jgi:hypothetical protein